MTRRWPPDLILLHWYICGRKTQLLTESIAYLYTGYRNAHYYRCPYGMHFHMGRKPTRQLKQRELRQHAKIAWGRMMDGRTPMYDGSPGRGYSDGRYA